jgi:hypothetical protein
MNDWACALSVQLIYKAAWSGHNKPKICHYQHFKASKCLSDVAKERFCPCLSLIVVIN